MSSAPQNAGLSGAPAPLRRALERLGGWLASPWATVALGLLAGLGLLGPGNAAFGLAPLLLLALSLVARGGLWGVPLALGLVLWLGSAHLSRVDRLSVNTGETVEAVLRDGLPLHLGGALVVAADRSAAFVSGPEAAAPAAFLSTQPATLGHHRVRLVEAQVGDALAWARLTLKTRGGADPQPMRLRVGEAGAFAGCQLALLALSPDLGPGLGAAAQVESTCEGQADRRWLLLESPELDERVGTSRLTASLQEVGVGERLTLSLRPAGEPPLGLIGCAFLALGLLGQWLRPVRHVG